MIGSFGHLMPQKSARVSLVKLTGSDPKIFSRVRFLLENSIQKRRSTLPVLTTFHHGKWFQWFCGLTEYGTQFLLRVADLALLCCLLATACTT